MTPRRSRPSRTHVVDGQGDVLETGGHCGLFIDMTPEDQAPMPGDWIATEAGSRYLVDDVRVVRRPRHTQQKRYRMRVLRLSKHAQPPADVRTIWLTWYPRGARR